jgi:hypothetical protein
MKNIIVTIALFLSTAAIHAQVVVKYNKHYHFSHDTGISTYDAFKNNLETNLGSFTSETIWTFDTAKMVFQMTSGNIRHNGYILNYDIILNKYGGIDIVFVVREAKLNSNNISVSVFQNTGSEWLLMTKARDRKHPNQYFGHQGVIIGN